MPAMLLGLCIRAENIAGMARSYNQGHATSTCPAVR